MMGSAPSRSENGTLSPSKPTASRVPNTGLSRWKPLALAAPPCRTSQSYTGLRHAVMAGLALTPLPASLAGTGLTQIRDGLPRLPEAEIVARFSRNDPPASARLLLELFEQQLNSRPL